MRRRPALPSLDLERTRTDWNDLADLNAAWFNVPRQDIVGQQWDLDAFFRGGQAYVARALARAEACGLTVPRTTALDFGCGLGRVTQGLAEHFDVVYGVDVSDRMIKLAQQHNKHGDRCRYVANAVPHLGLFADASIDLVFSNNALQHNSPEIIAAYLREFGRILSPNGVALFQVPVGRITSNAVVSPLSTLPKLHPKRVLNKLKGVLLGHHIESRYYRLRRLGLPKQWLFDTLGLRPYIPMNRVQESEIRSLYETLGCTVASVEHYTYEDLIHAQFLVVRHASRTPRA
jgi:ubiquinone/menaquinone biosynthesis C-methylase UbiE